MTEAEDGEIDLYGRMTFAHDVEQLLVPTLLSLPTFAGTYFDQASDGALVIRLTESDTETEDELRAIAPKGTVRFQLAKSSLTELRGSMDAVWSEWPRLTDAPLHSASIDERGNQLILGTDGVSAESLGGFTDSMTEALGVQVAIVQEEAPVEATCNVDTCYDPMKAGTRIRQGSQSGAYCSMAFHVTNDGGAKQFVTAGHCGFDGSNSWYQYGYGLLGIEWATLYGPASGSDLNGQDIMRVDLPDAQVSNNIINRAADVEGRGNPQTDEPACAMLAVSNYEVCGWVVQGYASWTGAACGCVIRGSRLEAMPIQLGDSGSPVYRLLSADTAIGIGLTVGTQTSTGYTQASKLRDALDEWPSWSIYTVD